MIIKIHPQDDCHQHHQCEHPYQWDTLMSIVLLKLDNRINPVVQLFSCHIFLFSFTLEVTLFCFLFLRLSCCLFYLFASFDQLPCFYRQHISINGPSKTQKHKQMVTPVVFVDPQHLCYWPYAQL